MLEAYVFCSFGTFAASDLGGIRTGRDGVFKAFGARISHGAADAGSTSCLDDGACCLGFFILLHKA